MSEEIIEFKEKRACINCLCTAHDSNSRECRRCIRNPINNILIDNWHVQQGEDAQDFEI